MILIEPFQQGKFLEQHEASTGRSSLGICARLTFDWVVSKLKGPAFDYADVDVQSSEAFMAPYTKEAFSLLTDAAFMGDQRFWASRYVVTDVLRMKEYLNKWGDSQGIRCPEGVRASLSHYVSTRLRWHGEVEADALMVAFYMRGTAGDLKRLVPHLDVAGPPERPIVAGHVVGLSLADHTFFDSNTGYYRLTDGNPALNAAEIEKYIATNYLCHGFTNNPYDRGIFRLETVLH